MLKTKHKKGISLSAAPAAILMLVVIGVVAVVGVQINDQLISSGTTSLDVNATANNASLGILTITENLELLGLMIIMGIIITVLLAAFGGFIGGGRGGL